ncbi:MAG: hypothetical protein COA97_11965 [Flavobacteriales bacterium]|nr:MAG: hypothetical protein COA97_11965 [Flavobacteriales bacterium]
MKTYISILRGINVSGQKKILMTDLKSLYQELGFANVQTYIQSGNVVFECKEASPIQLQEMIFDKIESHYGFEVPNLILTPAEIETALSDNPYPNIENPYFTFLSENPKQENINALNSISFDNEFFELIGKVIYSHYPNGAGRAKMNNNLIERKLKIRATSRNLNTTKKLLEMTKFTED